MVGRRGSSAWSAAVVGIVASCVILSTGLVRGQAEKPAEKPAEQRTPQAWIQELESGDIDRVEAATRAICQLGPQAAPIVPDLIRILEQDRTENRRHVLAIVQVIGPVAKDAVPAIRKKLFHEEFHTQYWACRALGAIGPDAKDGAADLGKLLSTRYTASVRRNAATALGKIGPGIGIERVELLTDLLRDRNHPVRVDAAIALADLGPAAKVAVPELRAALLDTRRDIRVPTVIALWKITNKSDDLIPVLFEEMETGSLPWEAAQALAVFGDAAKPYVPKLIERLKDSENDDQKATYIDALAAIGPAARAAESEIRKYLEHENEELAEAAQEALEKIGAVAAKPAQPKADGIPPAVPERIKPDAKPAGNPLEKSK